MDNADYYTEVFERLHSYYILITIHDLQEYPLADLKGLAHRLEGSLSLTPEQQQLNQALTLKSDHNVQMKKNKKKQKKQQQHLPDSYAHCSVLEKTKESSRNSILQELDSFDINESVCYPEKEHEKWQVTCTRQGFIYDGKLQIKLEVGVEGGKKRMLLSFYLCSEEKTSVITAKSVGQLVGSRRQNIKEMTVEVEGKRHRFGIVQEGSNRLGLDFLREHKVVTICNYRPEVFTFQLQFTS